MKLVVPPGVTFAVWGETDSQPEPVIVLALACSVMPLPHCPFTPILNVRVTAPPPASALKLMFVGEAACNVQAACTLSVTSIFRGVLTGACVTLSTALMVMVPRYVPAASPAEETLTRAVAF